MQDGSLKGSSVQPGTEAAHVHASGEPDRVAVGGSDVVALARDVGNKELTPQAADDHAATERISAAASFNNSLGQSNLGDASRDSSWDEIDKKLRGGVDEYLQLFFGTTELAKDMDVIRPGVDSWKQCIFDKTCKTMSTIPIPQGRAADRQEAELDLIYSILYVVLIHLMAMHPEKKQRIRTVRFRITDVCMQRNKRLMVLRREEEKESK